MTSTQPELAPRVIEPTFTTYRPGSAFDSNTFKNSMLLAAERLAMQLFQSATNRWIRRGQALQLDHNLLIGAENQVREVRGGFSSVEDTLALLDGVKERHATLGTWMGHDLYLLLLRDIVESCTASTYERKVHNALMRAIEDAVELLASSHVWGGVNLMFPEWAKGLALAQLLVNWAPIPTINVGRRALVHFRGSISGEPGIFRHSSVIAWPERMAYDAAARRMEDELTKHGFQGEVMLWVNDHFMVITPAAKWREDDYSAAFDVMYDDASPFRGMFVEQTMYHRFQELLAEELAREIVYTPTAE